MNIEAIEHAVLTAPTVGESLPIDLDFMPTATVYQFPTQGSDKLDHSEGSETLLESPEVELMTMPSFQEQWALMHDMAGGMIQMRTGATCPLGEAARSEGGIAACDAVYKLALTNDTIARLLLSTKSTFIGQLMVIAVHGNNCMKIVKASASVIPPEVSEGLEDETD